MKIGKKLVLFLLGILLLTGCAKPNEQIQKTGLHLNTVIQVTLYDAAQEPLLEECFRMADEYEQMLSATVEGSDVWNINHNGHKGVLVKDETGYLLEQALGYAKQTNGAVDPTIGAVSTLWDFSSEKKEREVPNADLIKQACTYIGYDKVIFTKQAEGYLVKTTDENVRVDLGFIAKGYIADKMKEYLLENHVEHGIINLGGNILTIGAKPTGDLFSIGIKKPFSENGETITNISVKDKSVVSSGIYERYFEKEDKLYHHILDTETGYPIENDVYHVTIVSESSMQGDALSTACLVLGKDKGMELIEQTPDCEAIFITNTYEIYKTSGLK
ncbi:MAG: FAD:protein FMN transferase [Lachnospiraceae bacterium]|nr:FAD:protein FMN transferase [Lachnospiraceae bacterium]